MKEVWETPTALGGGAFHLRLLEELDGTAKNTKVIK